MPSVLLIGEYTRQSIERHTEPVDRPVARNREDDQVQRYPLINVIRKAKTLTNLVSTDGGRQDLEGLRDLGMEDEVGNESLRHGVSRTKDIELLLMVDDR